MEEESKEKKENRGGARPGAGRPRTGSKLYAFRFQKPIVECLDKMENKTDFVKACVVKGLMERVPDFDRIGEVYPIKKMKEAKLPFFDIGIVAGFPVPLDNDERAQDIDLLSMLTPHPEASYLIRVEGNSMIDAGIESGDIVIVDRSKRSPSEREVAVCELNGEYTLKRFVRRKGEGWLVPANPDYPRIKVTPDDIFSIWGTVTYVIHKPKRG